MAIAFVQSTHSTALTTAAFGSNNTAGNMIIVFVTQQGNVTFSCSDSAGNVYTPLAVQHNIPNTVSAQIFYSIGIAGNPANTITVTPSSGTPGSIAIHEFSGLSAFDVSAAATGQGNVEDSGAAVTNFANELLFGYETGNTALGQATATVGVGWTLAETIGSQYLTQYQIVSATGSYNSTTTTTTIKSGVLNWIEQIATFRAPATAKSNFFAMF